MLLVKTTLSFCCMFC